VGQGIIRGVQTSPFFGTTLILVGSVLARTCKSRFYRCYWKNVALVRVTGRCSEVNQKNFATLIFQNRKASLKRAGFFFNATGGRVYSLALRYRQKRKRAQDQHRSLSAFITRKSAGSA
jgi:hypothetical protein